MAAGENQAELVVGEHVVGCVGVRFGGGRGDRISFCVFVALVLKPSIAAKSVDGFVARGADEPGARVRRLAFSGPFFQSDGVGFLQHFLGEIEIAEQTNERGQDSARLFAVKLFEIHVAGSLHAAGLSRSPSGVESPGELIADVGAEAPTP